MQKAHNKFYLIGLAVFIWVAPLPFGCVGRVFSPLFYLCLLSLGFFGYRQAFHRRDILGKTWILRAGFVTAVFFLLQLAPLPVFLLRIVSPRTVATLSQLKESMPSFHSISLVPFQTLETLLQLSVMALLFWVLANLDLKRREMVGILNTVVYSAVFQTLFGLAKYFSGNKKFFLLFHPQKQDVYSRYLTGTIGNPNHFAFFLELAMPLALAMLFVQVEKLKIFPSFQERLHQILDFKNRSLVFLGATMLFGLGILLTGSRAGIVTSILSLLVFLQLSVYLAGKREIRRRLKWIFVSIVLLASIMGIQNTIHKFATSPLHEGGRMTRWPDSLKMASDFPLVGTGFGTYKFAFFLYDSDGVKWSTHAHNDYLEVLTDGGIAGGLAVLFLVWSLLHSYIRRWWERRHPQIKLLGTGILVAFFAALFHSLFDFSLRIPSNLFFVTLLAGIGVNLVTYRRDQSQTIRRKEHPFVMNVIFGVLSVFFVLQFLSHISMRLGQGISGAGQPLLKLSSLLMPLDSEAHLGYGYRLLQANEEHSDPKKLLAGIGALERAVSNNMLQYNAHYYLAKGLLFADRPGNPQFDRAVGFFRNAGWLRSKNPAISLDSLKVNMSLWQLLEEKDRTFVRKLFADAVGQLDSNQMKEILELWGLYIRDIGFLETGLKHYPHFYLEAALKLRELEMDLAQSQSFLAHYETYWLDYSRKKFAGFLELKNPPLPELESFLRRFSNSIVGYHALVPGVQFDTENYLSLKRRLYLTVIQAMLAREDGFKYLERQDKIVALVSAYLASFPSERHLNDLMALLENHQFFPRSGLQGQELRLLILRRMQKNVQLISEGHELKESISFVTSDQEYHYAGILLAMADGYMATGNYIEALNTLEEARLFASRKHETFWLLRQLLDRVGEGGLPAATEGTIRTDPSLPQIELENRASRYITVDSLRKSAIVYPMGEGTLEIHAGDTLRPKLEGKHLVQVFVEERLVGESYLGDWLDGPLVIRLAPPLQEKVFKVVIKII